MYARYTRTRVGTDATRYVMVEKEISLFGCNNGYIPWLLSFKIPPAQSEPYYWHVGVVGELHAQAGYTDSALVIDLKPKQNKKNVSLYEVLDVWGVSADEWTPILLRLNGLFVDEKPELIDRGDFVRKDSELSGPIYEFLYLTGSVAGGAMKGSWAPPPASPTNAALLWPDTLNYFFQCIRECTPDILEG